MLAVAFKGLHVAMSKSQTADVKELQRLQADAMDKACRGDMAWRKAIESGGKTVLDYWDGSKVIYPPMLNHGNTSSKLSFLYYLAHSLPNIMQDGFEDLFEQLKLAHEALLADDFWIINNLSDVVI